MKPLRRLSLVLAAASTLAAAGAAGAQVVVLFARGPSAASYPPGTVLPANRVLRLKTGDQLELLDGAGSHILTGPAVTPAGHVDARVRDQLIQTFLKAQQSRPGIAASRGLAADDSAAPALWQADVADGGLMCLAKGATPGLWRADARAASGGHLTRLATGVSVALSFPAGAAAIDWPAGMPATEGESYAVSLDDGSTGTVTWKAVPAPTAGFGDLARSLDDAGCYAQLDRLRAVFGVE